MATYIKSGDKIAVCVFNTPYVIKVSDARYRLIHSALKNEKSDQEILDIIQHGKPTVKQYIETQAVEGISFKDGKVYLDGKPLHNAIASRIEDFARDGLPVKHMLKFLANLELNPSYNSREQLYNFLEYKDLVITDDGHFLAYKSVQENYMDWHTGTISNHPGAKPSMDRRLIDDNPNSACSRGLHVGALNYASSFHGGRRIVIVKVNPRDVVSVPHDSSCQKCRVCLYEVLSDMGAKMQGALYTGDGKPYEVEVPTDFDFSDEPPVDDDRYDVGDVIDSSDDDIIQLEKIEL